MDLQRYLRSLIVRPQNILNAFTPDRQTWTAARRRRPSRPLHSVCAACLPVGVIRVRRTLYIPPPPPPQRQGAETTTTLTYSCLCTCSFLPSLESFISVWRASDRPLMENRYYGGLWGCPGPYFLFSNYHSARMFARVRDFCKIEFFSSFMLRHCF